MKAQRIGAEALGTGLLLATVIGSGIMGERLADGNVALALLGNTLATGAMLVVLITMFGPISGAHFNPSVTAVFALRKDISSPEAAGYVAAQIGGGIVGVVLALDLTHRGWTALADALASYYDPATRTVLLAIGASAAVGAILGLLNRMAGGLSDAFGGIVAGAVIGAIIGLVTVISFPPTAGAALGVLVALVVWPVLAARDVMRTGVDGEAIMKKFTPDETIGLTKETIEWVRARMPLVPRS